MYDMKEKTLYLNNSAGEMDYKIKQEISLFFTKYIHHTAGKTQNFSNQAQKLLSNDEKQSYSWIPPSTNAGAVLQEKNVTRLDFLKAQLKDDLEIFFDSFTVNENLIHPELVREFEEQKKGIFNDVSFKLFEQIRVAIINGGLLQTVLDKRIPSILDKGKADYLNFRLSCRMCDAFSG